MTCGIYKIETRKGRFYIGSSKNIEHRISIHFSALRNNNHGNRRFQGSFNRNGKIATWEVLKVCSENELIEFEQKAMDEFHPNLNLSLIAGKVEFTKDVLARAQAWKSDPVKGPAAFAKIKEANTGKMATLEARAKMSATRKGRPAWNKGIPFTEEHKAKLRANSQKGKKFTPERLEKFRARIAGRPGPATGHIASPESREKMRQSSLRRWRREKSCQASV